MGSRGFRVTNRNTILPSSENARLAHPTGDEIFDIEHLKGTNLSQRKHCVVLLFDAITNSFGVSLEHVRAIVETVDG